MQVSPVFSNELPFQPTLPKSCLGRVWTPIKSIVLFALRWLICRISALFGFILQGNLNNQKLAQKLKQFDLHQLVKSKQVTPSRVLSSEAQKLILNSYDGLTGVRDTHLHILGVGEDNHTSEKENSGSAWIKNAVIHCAASGTVEGSAKASAERLQLYASTFPGLVGHILPICPVVNAQGQVDLSNTSSALGNVTAMKTAATFSSQGSQLRSAVSVHPNDPKWKEKLEAALKMDIRVLKWHPEIQGIDPEAVSEEFYQFLRDHNFCLLSHSGPVHAVNRQKAWENYAHPKRFEKALKLGVNVILAHCGHPENIDDFEALALAAHQNQWPGKLFGDTAAMLHYGPDFVRKVLLLAQKPYARIWHGSDYPYTQLVKFKDGYVLLAKARLLDQNIVKPLKEIRNFHPLLADFVAKRNLRTIDNGLVIRFPISVFSTD